jgi:hypothetical protein
MALIVPSNFLIGQIIFLYEIASKWLLCNGLTVWHASADGVDRQVAMNEKRRIRDFGYRAARHPFPKMVSVEIAQGTNNFRLIGTHGIDISVDGIAVAADTLFDPAESVTLAIPLADGSVARVPGRVLRQTEDYCRFAFEFASGEQFVQIKELIAKSTRVW